jgi:hypothetical protein
MRAYQTIIAENTTLVLSTDSDLFKYLKGMSPDAFSTFPMFSWGREDPLARVEHVVAVFADSRREALPPSRDKNSHPRFGAAGRVSPARIDANRV